jgi:BirA family transcriptional regulator, biotin operon repressor / biotin---[acetyl-CoA-carboxylase] ligase
MEKPIRSTFDNQLIELDSVDSTNNYAMARIHEGMARNGMVCLARNQWAGKGQRGKIWQSEPGQNLIMSLVIEPGSLILSQQFLLSASAALGIMDLIRSFGQGNWTIKWPNDIYWNDRKAAGILVENVVKGKSWPFAVVGVGMNLNQDSFPPEISNATSLMQVTGMQYDPVQFARELVPLIENRISLLRKNPDQVLSDFNHHLYKRNKSVALKKGNEVIIAEIIGVNERGLLVTDTGSFNLGEVEFILKS